MDCKNHNTVWLDHKSVIFDHTFMIQPYCQEQAEYICFLHWGRAGRNAPPQKKIKNRRNVVHSYVPPPCFPCLSTSSCLGKLLGGQRVVLRHVEAEHPLSALVPLPPSSSFWLLLKQTRCTKHSGSYEILSTHRNTDWFYTYTLLFPANSLNLFHNLDIQIIWFILVHHM